MNLLLAVFFFIWLACFIATVWTLTQNIISRYWEDVFGNLIICSLLLLFPTLLLVVYA